MAKMKIILKSDKKGSVTREQVRAAIANAKIAPRKGKACLVIISPTEAA